MLCDIQICKYLQNNSSLNALNVSWNGFYVDGCKELAYVLGKNKSLQFLDLSANRINKECLNYLIKGLHMNTTLQALKVC